MPRRASGRSGRLAADAKVAKRIQLGIATPTSTTARTTDDGVALDAVEDIGKMFRTLKELHVGEAANKRRPRVNVRTAGGNVFNEHTMPVDINVIC